MSARWGGSRWRHAHRRRDDDIRTVIGALYFLLTILVLVVVRPL